jgi:O-antigen/teichoic acid export membrane protein
MLVAPGLLLEVAFGAPYREAALPLLLLTVANVGNVLSGMCGTALTMSHQEGAVAAVQSSSVGLRVVLGTAAAVVFGLVGLAAVAAVLTVLTYTAMWWLARRRLGLRTEPTLRPRLEVLRRTAG